MTPNDRKPNSCGRFERSHTIAVLPKRAGQGFECHIAAQLLSFVRPCNSAACLYRRMLDDLLSFIYAEEECVVDWYCAATLTAAATEKCKLKDTGV